MSDSNVASCAVCGTIRGPFYWAGMHLYCAQCTAEDTLSTVPVDDPIVANITDHHSHFLSVTTQGHLRCICEKCRREIKAVKDAATGRLVEVDDPKRVKELEDALRVMVKMAKGLPTFPGTPVEPVLANWFMSALMQAEEALEVKP